MDFLLTVDPPTHGVERQVFSRCFGPPLRQVAADVESVVLRAMEALDGSEELDLVSELCMPVAVEICGRVLGRAESGLGLEAHATILLAEADRTNVGPLNALRRELLALGRPHHLVEGQLHGLTCALLVAFECTLPAAIALALANPRSEQGSPLRADSPLLGLFRVVTESTWLGDRHLDSGEQVFVALASANWQCRKGDQVLDLSFGAGPHLCPARRLVQLVVSTILARRPLMNLCERPLIAEHSHARLPVHLRAIARDGRWT